MFGFTEHHQNELELAACAATIFTGYSKRWMHMKLQQLRYLVAAAQYGSFRTAAQKLYVSQSSVSTAVKELEQELGVEIFNRTRRGISLTSDGVELLGHVKQLLAQADDILDYYSQNRENKLKLNVSSLHNLLVAKAFGDFLEMHSDEACNFELYETYINQIIRDVHSERSDLGIIYKSNFNSDAIEQILDQEGLAFTTLFTSRPYVVVGDYHPLAGHELIEPRELASYDRFELSQGFESSSFYTDEPISSIPHRRKIVLSDNSSLAAILAEHNGYAISTGISPANRSLTLIPLDTEEIMQVGIVRLKHEPDSQVAREFLLVLCRRIIGYEGAIEPADAVYEYTRIKRS